MKIKMFIAWFDIWIGMFIDKKNKTIYICPLPCIVIKINMNTHES